MAHELKIRTQDGEAAMMYVDEAPWHRLGQKLDRPATAAEAIQAAHLDWGVAKEPLFTKHGDEMVRVPGRFAMVPDDGWDEPNHPVFGIVGAEYTPLQNRDAFGFFDGIVGEGEAIYHTAGALGEGERIWILAKLPSYIRVIGDDITEKYLLLSNTHGGNGSVQVKFTPIRVVCENTLTMALEFGRALRAPHRSRLHQNLGNVRDQLGLIHRGYDEIEEAVTAMVRVRMDRERLGEYLTLVFPDSRNPDNQSGLKQAKEHRGFAEELFGESRANTLPGVQGTLWAAYNGVTEFVDHCHSQRRHRDPGWMRGRRLHSVWFGEGARTKARAYRTALDKISAWG